MEVFGSEEIIRGDNHEKENMTVKRMQEPSLAHPSPARYPLRDVLNVTSQPRGKLRSYSPITPAVPRGRSARKSCSDWTGLNKSTVVPRDCGIPTHTGVPKESGDPGGVMINSLVYNIAKQTVQDEIENIKQEYEKLLSEKNDQLIQLQSALKVLTSEGYDEATGGCDEATGGCDEATGGYDEATGGCDEATGGCDKATGGYDEATGGYDEATGGCDEATGGYDEATGGCDEATCGCDDATGGCDGDAGYVGRTGVIDGGVGSVECQTDFTPVQEDKSTMTSPLFKYLRRVSETGQLDVSELQRQLELAAMSADVWRMEVGELERGKGEREEEMRELRGRVESFESRITQAIQNARAEMQTELNKSAVRERVLEREIERLTEQVREKDSAVQLSTNQLTAAQQQNTQLQDQQRVLYRQKKQADESVERYRSLYEETSRAFRSVQSQLDQVTSLAPALDQARNTQDRVSKEMQETFQALTELDQYICKKQENFNKEKNDWEQKRAVEQRRLESLKQELVELEQRSAALHELNARVEELSEELESMTERADGLSAALSTEHERLLSTSRELEQRSEQIKKLESEQSVLQDSLTSLQEQRELEIINLERTLERREGECDELKSENERLRQRIIMHKCEIDRLRKETKICKEMEAKITDYRNKLQMLEQKTVESVEATNRDKQKISGLERDLSGVMQCKQSLEAELAEIRLVEQNLRSAYEEEQRRRDQDLIDKSRERKAVLESVNHLSHNMNSVISKLLDKSLDLSNLMHLVDGRSSDTAHSDTATLNPLGGDLANSSSNQESICEILSGMISKLTVTDKLLITRLDKAMSALIEERRVWESGKQAYGRKLRELRGEVEDGRDSVALVRRQLDSVERQLQQKIEELNEERRRFEQIVEASARAVDQSTAIHRLEQELGDMKVVVQQKTGEVEMLKGVIEGRIKDLEAQCCSQGGQVYVQAVTSQITLLMKENQKIKASHEAQFFKHMKEEGDWSNKECLLNERIRVLTSNLFKAEKAIAGLDAKIEDIRKALTNRMTLIQSDEVLLSVLRSLTQNSASNN